MKLIPMPGVVLVEPLKDDTVMQSTGRDYTNAARVVAVNPLNKDISVSSGRPQEGDIIFYDEYSYRRFEHDKQDIFAVDTRGEGVWIIGKLDNDERSETEPMQEEGLSAPIPTSTTNE